MVWQLLIASVLLSQAPAEPPGAADYMAGRLNEARASLESGLAGGQATARTHFWLGYTYLALGQRDRAIPSFEAYLKDNPRDEDVLYAVARTYAQLSDMSLQQIFVLDPKSARSFQMRGIRFEVESSWKEAIQAYLKALGIDPKLRGVHASIGRIYRAELKDEAAAIREYQAELKIDPANREANKFFAGYYAQRRPTAARSHNAALALGPPASGDAAQGIYWLEHGSAEKSLPFLMRWRASEPRGLDVYYYLGEAFTDMKVATIKRLRAANPESYRLHQILAESYASAHQTTKAVEEYRKALALEPALPGVRYELGRLLGDTQTREAITLLEGELQLDPEHYMAAAWLGRIYVVEREPDKAISLLERALTARPELTDARKALGQALLAKREFAKALPHLETVARELPDDGQIHFLLAQAYQASGRKEDAARERALHQQTINRLTAPAEELMRK